MYKSKVIILILISQVVQSVRIQSIAKKIAKVIKLQLKQKIQLMNC